MECLWSHGEFVMLFQGWTLDELLVGEWWFCAFIATSSSLSSWMFFRVFLLILLIGLHLCRHPRPVKCSSLRGLNNLLLRLQVIHHLCHNYCWRWIIWSETQCLLQGEPPPPWAQGKDGNTDVFADELLFQQSAKRKKKKEMTRI